MRSRNMKSIQRRFRIIRERNPSWSSFISFAEAIEWQGFSKKMIYYWFNRLVEKDDYERSEKRYHLAHLLNLTKRAEDGIKQGEI